MQCVIIGNGAAGAYAAQQIRLHAADAKIIILSREPYTLYARPRLHEIIAGTATPDSIIIHTPEWYKSNNIDFRAKTDVLSIDTETKTIVVNTNDRIPYDKLLIATGSVPFRIPLSGSADDMIYSIKTIDDAVRLQERAENSHTAVLIGGGLLGLETANALLAHELTVTVIEMFDRLLPRQIDAEGSLFIQHSLESMGYHFHLGVKTKEIVSDNGQSVLILDNGTAIECDFIQMSLGIRAVTELVNGTAIETNHGIIVNEKMETSVPDVYAAGDCVVVHRRNYGLWTAAKAMGEVAGKNIAGGEAVFSSYTPSTVLKVAGISLVSIGDITASDTRDIQEYKRINREKGIYIKVFSEAGKICGGIVIGDAKIGRTVKNAIGSPVQSIIDVLQLSA